MQKWPEIKGWIYSGDVNLEYGGTFYRIDPAEWDMDGGYCEAVRVIPCSDAGGQDNAWWVETLTVLRPDTPERANAALSCCGWELTKYGHIVVDYAAEPVALKGTDLHRQVMADACMAYGNYDVEVSCCVQIGKRADVWRESDRVEPDEILRGNAKLLNYVRRFAKEV